MKLWQDVTPDMMPEEETNVDNDQFFVTLDIRWRSRSQTLNKFIEKLDQEIAKKTISWLTK